MILLEERMTESKAAPKKISTAQSKAQPIGQAARPKASARGMYEDKTQSDIPRNAAIYVRVSTAEQVQGYSIDVQERLCREFIKKHKPGWAIVEVFRDEGKSGTNVKRPGFKGMLQAVNEGKIDAIVCHRLDRFSRNLHDILVYFKLLEDQKVFLSFADEQFDFSTPEGKTYFNFLAIFADWYLKNLSRETKKSNSSMVLTGRQNNTPPFGYKKRENGVFEIIPEEAELVKDAFEKYATGNYTAVKIADIFNAKGILTRRNLHWSKESVRTLLQLDFYYGAVKYLDTLHSGDHQALISKELFEQVQVVRKAHAMKPRTVTEKFDRIYLLGGLIRCASCGCNLRAQGSREHQYYREVSHLRGLECPDARKSFPTEIVEQQVGDIVQGFRLPRGWQKEIRTALNPKVERDHFEQERQELLTRLQRLGDLYLEGSVERKAYLSSREELNQSLKAVTLLEPAQVIETGKMLESFLQIWPLADQNQKRDICHLMFEWVEADMQTARITRVNPRKEFTRFFDQNPMLIHVPRGGYAPKVPFSAR